MKKLIISLFVFLCFTSCTVKENEHTLVVRDCNNTNIKEGVTTYIISAYDSGNYRIDVISYRTKIGTFEIGDTVIIIKK